MTEENSELKVVIATGGTGGHLFPAQGLAADLRQCGRAVDIVFLGANLSRNPYFHRQEFYSKDVASATFSTKSGWRVFRALFLLQKGVWQALSFFRAFPPDVVVGFGSFYSLPTLIAAKLKRIPIILFESNVLPGRVNRFCSRWASLSAVQFFVSQQRLKGKTVCVNMPLLQRRKGETRAAARNYFGLDQERFTLLVFGGSQGAQPINCLVCGAIDLLKQKGIDFQVIHFVGSTPRAQKLKDVYQRHEVVACVKAFETRMDLAWTAADLSISRAGSATLAEHIEFEVPGIFIPFPHGTDNHQSINAAFVEEEIGGALELVEADCLPERLVAMIRDLHKDQCKKLREMKSSLETYKRRTQKEDLAQVVLAALGDLAKRKK